MDETYIGNLDDFREYLEGFLEKSMVFAWETDTEGRYSYLSPGVEQVTGFTPEDCIGRVATDFLVEADAARTFKKFDHCMRKKISKFNITHRHRCKNGELKWTDTTAVLQFDGRGNIERVRGIARDISVQKKIEEKIVQQEKEYRYLFANSQVGLFIIRKDGVLLNVNSKGASFFQKSPDEMIGKNLSYTALDPEGEKHLALFLENFRKIENTSGKMCYFGEDVRVLDTPGGLRHIKFFPNVVKVYRNNDVDAVLCTAIDVTEVVKSESRILEYQNHLEKLVEERTREIKTLQEEMVLREREAALGKLTATVSHEIRNPLGVIRNSLFVIAQRLKGKNLGVDAAVKRAERAIGRCDGIIGELYDFVWNKKLQKATVNLSQWLKTWLDEQAVSDKIRFVRKIDVDLQANIDAERFALCIGKILENAVQAVCEKTGATISVGCRRSDDDSIELSISDNGPGIPAEHMEKIFEPLFSTKSFGVGLGLCIARQIANQHGGKLEISSAIGKGTKAILHVPFSGKPETVIQHET